MARQFRPGQLQTGSLYNISSSYAVTASYALNGGGTGTNIDTGSFVTTSSFNAFTASYTTGSFTGSFIGDGSQLTGIVSSKWTGSNPISRQSDVEITGSLRVQGSITGSLLGTASWAENYNETDPVFTAISGSFATTGSNVFIGNQTVTGSLFTTGSNTLIGSTTLTGSLNIFGSTTQIGNNTLLGNTTLSGSIIISGSKGTTNPSVRIYGDTTHDGYVRFDPVSTNIDTSISASYIYVSGSTQDLYFSQNGAGYTNTSMSRVRTYLSTILFNSDCSDEFGSSSNAQPDNLTRPTNPPTGTSDSIKHSRIKSRKSCAVMGINSL